MLPKYFTVDNFLSAEEMSLLTVDEFNTYISSKGKTINYYQPVNIDSILSKVKEVVGSCVVRDYYIYNIKEPYRIHNDAGKNHKSYYTVIVPLTLSGGFYILNQYSEETFLIDDYLSLEGQKNLLLDVDSRTANIVNYDVNVCLPDIEELSHIKAFDKIGFSIDTYLEFTINRAVFFESKYYHCSENTNNYNKQSLVIFLDRE